MQRLCRSIFSLSRAFVAPETVVPKLDLDPVEYYKNRLAYINDLKLSGLNPYPHKFEVSSSLPAFISENSYLTRGEKSDTEYSIAGRVISIRQHGKLIFFDLQSEGKTLQVMSDIKHYKGDFKELFKIHRGDIIGINGFPLHSSPRTSAGELSIVPFYITVLSHCLRMLPGHSGLKDTENRYRHRYLDLIVNPGNREIFITRTRIIKYIRAFLDTRGFLEVETPMMNMIPGGAAAKPFETYHDSLNMKLFMRIAPELYLKTLVVGGFERVYEIGKQFRNEGIDMTHNPEFTTCEFYWAYADYKDLIKITEEIISGLVKELTGGYILQYTKHDQQISIDFTPPFKRLSMIEEIQKGIGRELPKDLSSEDSRIQMIRICEEFGVEVQEPKTNARVIDKLCGRFVENQCVQPTFIVDHPQVMSPLAKSHRENKELTERFELFVNCSEICNAYTELNDPVVQRELFEAQSREREKGDCEAQRIDEGFCLSLEHGLPPTAGWGLGVDRLTMILTNQSSIKEVLLFPAMKPQS